MLKYIIEFLFCSGLFMALYKLLIERHVSHSWARKYLVAAMFLSFIIPTLELPLYPAKTIYYEIPAFTPSAEPKSDIPAYLDDSAMPVMEPQLEKYAIDTEQTTTYEEATSSTIDWAWVLERAIWAIYFIIVALNLARFAWRIYIIYKLRRHSQLTIYELYTLAVNEQVREPFSFWRTIYMNRSMLAAKECNQVISHELSHIRHHHTAERLALELLRCVAWFNPFVWLAGSALVEVHEWQADSDVLSEGYDVYEYRQLIFRQLFGYTPDLTNGLGSSQTSKKRFLMMTDFKKGKYSFLRLGATLPLVAALILAFGAVRAETEIIPIMKSESSVNEPTTAAPQNNGDVVITSTGEIKYNGKTLSFEEFKQQLTTDSETISSLNISTEEGAKMSVLEEVKLAAREAKIYKIRYVSTQQTTSIVLPPLAEQSQDPTNDPKVTDIAIANRNHLPVCINANNKVMTRRPNGDLGIVEKEELMQIVKSFVNNTESVDGKRCTKNKYYSDFEWTTISDGENGERHYPVSQGLISIITDTNASAEKFIEVQQTITAAHDELRNELAQEMFKKPFASLNADDSAFIRRAIPMKVYEGDTPFEKMITLNHGTYTCAGYGLSHASNPAERNALRKSLEATILKVVSDTEIDVTTDDDWDIFKSGRYTYTLTRDTFTLKNKDASYSFKCEFTGPLYKATLKLIFDKQSGHFANMLFIGPTETKDKEVRVSFGPNGTVYFNGEQTTVEELREKHYMNFDAPIVQPGGTLGGNMEDVIKQNPYIYLVVGPDSFSIKEGERTSTQFSLADITTTKTRTQVEKFITEKAPSTMQEFKWWNGKKWNHPVSQGIIYIDVMEGATVANVRAARDMAKWAINSLREKESVKQVNVVYGRLNEPDCATLEAAIPENIILSPRAEAVMNLSPETDVIHIVADQTPRFLGKQGKEACEAFTDWLKEQLKNNKEYQNAFKQNPQYIGGIRVIIEKDGSMSVIDKYYSMGFILNSLITQTCATAPKWTPAKHNGKPVRMQLDVVLHNNDNIDIRLEYPFDKKIKTTKSVPRGVAVNPKQKNHNHKDNPCQYKITKVTLTDEQTVVDLHVKFWHNWWITLESNDKLITESKIYPIQDVKGATLDVKYWMPESGEATFQLIFPPIDCKVDKITFGEDWVIEDIDLSKLRPINEQEHAATPPHLADGEYRPIGVIKKPSQDDGKDVVDKARELLPIIKVKGDKIIVEGNHYKDFVEPGKYTYQILDDGRILINGTGVGYNFPYEYATLSTGANLLDLKFTSKIDNTQILGVMYTREDWEN